MVFRCSLNELICGSFILKTDVQEHNIDSLIAGQVSNSPCPTYFAIGENGNARTHNFHFLQNVTV